MAKQNRGAQRYDEWRYVSDANSIYQWGEVSSFEGLIDIVRGNGQCDSCEKVFKSIFL